jgi:hypothetical protein
VMGLSRAECRSCNVFVVVVVTLDLKSDIEKNSDFWEKGQSVNNHQSS